MRFMISLISLWYGIEIFEGISHILDEVEKARRRLIANVNFEVAIEMLLVTIKENGKVW